MARSRERVAHSAVAELEAQAREWQGRLSAASEAIRELQGVSGDEVANDPSLLTKVASRLQEARDEADMSQRALAAVERRLDSARVAALQDEANLLQRDVDAAAKALADHQARTAELLTALEEHECVFVPERDVVRARRSAGLPVAAEWSSPRSEALAEAVDHARMRVSIVRDVAAGVDPRVRLREASDPDSLVFGVDPLSLYPACVWGPGAILPAPAFVDAVEQQRRLLADFDVWAAGDDSSEDAQDMARIEELDQTAEWYRSQRKPLPDRETSARMNREQRIEQRRAARESAPVRRRTLVAPLEALVGTGATQS